VGTAHRPPVSLTSSMPLPRRAQRLRTPPRARCPCPDANGTRPCARRPAAAGTAERVHRRPSRPWQHRHAAVGLALPRQRVFRSFPRLAGGATRRPTARRWPVGGRRRGWPGSQSLAASRDGRSLTRPGRRGRRGNGDGRWCLGACELTQVVASSGAGRAGVLASSGAHAGVRRGA